MIRHLVSTLDYAACAGVALALFVAAFAAILWGAMRLSRRAADRFASIPLNDQVEDLRSE